MKLMIACHLQIEEKKKKEIILPTASALDQPHRSRSPRPFSSARPVDRYRILLFTFCFSRTALLHTLALVHISVCFQRSVFLDPKGSCL